MEMIVLVVVVVGVVVGFSRVGANTAPSHSPNELAASSLYCRYRYHTTDGYARTLRYNATTKVGRVVYERVLKRVCSFGCHQLSAFAYYMFYTIGRKYAQGKVHTITMRV